MKHPNSLSLRRRVALELWRKRMDIAVKEHPLRQLFWECTQRCNLHCRHCGSDCRAEVGVADMPLADFTRVLDSVALRTDPNRVFVVVTGGEPLMRHDIAECGAAIYERGFPWGMVTNALALTPLKFQSLLDAGIHSMTSAWTESATTTIGCAAIPTVSEWWTAPLICLWRIRR